MSEELINIGKKFKEQRKRLGMSQAELAEKLDIHEKQVYRIEIGKNSPSILTVLKMIKILGMDIRVLDAENIQNFNPIKDEIYSLIEDASVEELVMYRNVISAIKSSQRLTTKEKEQIRKTAIIEQKKI